MCTRTVARTVGISDRARRVARKQGKSRAEHSERRIAQLHCNTLFAHTHLTNGLQPVFLSIISLLTCQWPLRGHSFSTNIEKLYRYFATQIHQCENFTDNLLFWVNSPATQTMSAACSHNTSNHLTQNPKRRKLPKPSVDKLPSKIPKKNTVSVD